MIGEGDVVEPVMDIVDIERGKAAVAALHADEPVQGPVHRAASIGRHRSPDAWPRRSPPCRRDRGRSCSRTETPSRRRGSAGAIALPIAGLLEQLLRRAASAVHDRHAVAAAPEPSSCIANAARAVSHIGETHGWQYALLGSLTSSFCSARLAPITPRIIARVPEYHQSLERIDHRGENGPEAVLAVQSFEYPGLSASRRAPAQRLGNQRIELCVRSDRGRETRAPAGPTRPPGVRK